MFSVKELQKKKEKKEKIAMVTAYDATFAKIAEDAGIDQILVGDSLANTMLGYKSTREIGMTEMEIFVAAVCRGAKNTHVVADMPYGSYDTKELALENAKKLLACGASSVKLEGACKEIIETLSENKIEVMGHLGLLPQTATSFRQCGKTLEDACRIKAEAKLLNALGIYSFVLEHIPEALGKEITEESDAITIGIGAGKYTDGQVLVMQDLLKMRIGKLPPFVNPTANLYEAALEGFSKYIEQVKKN